jgi:hypothetical protein
LDGKKSLPLLVVVLRLFKKRKKRKKKDFFEVSQNGHPTVNPSAQNLVLFFLYTSSFYDWTFACTALAHHHQVPPSECHQVIVFSFFFFSLFIWLSAYTLKRRTREKKKGEEESQGRRKKDVPLIVHAVRRVSSLLKRLNEEESET